MLLGMEPIETSLRIATAVAPVAMYFLLLGFLNTRRHPQMLSGRQDSALLTLALSPLLIAPVVHWVGGGLQTALACAAVLAGGIWMLSPRGRTCVIYNLSGEQVHHLTETLLQRMGFPSHATETGLRIGGDNGRIEISQFPVLRNVTLHLVGGNDAFWQEFEEGLHHRLQQVDTEPSPMAVTLLLVATAMIVAPLTLLVQHGPEIVRLLTDLLP